MSVRSINYIQFILLLAISSNSQGQFLNYSFNRITVKDGLPQASINDVIQDKTGFIWFATYNGISRFDGFNFLNIHFDPDVNEGISNNATTFLMEDNEGNIWILNSGETGIDKFDPINNTYINYKHDPKDPASISHNNANHIMLDSKGDIWVCTENALNLVINEDDKISFKRFPFPNSTLTFPFLYENKENVYFLFSEKNKYFFNKNKSVFQTISDTLLPIYYYNSFIEDKNGNFITIYNGSILSLKFDSEILAFNIKENLNLNIPISNKNSIILDQEDNLWIGNEKNGLFKYNYTDYSLEHFIHNEQNDLSLSDNSIRKLFIDKTGVLWIGTENEGVNKYDLYRKKFFHYKSVLDDTNSLSGNIISGMHSISNDELWVGVQSDFGINRLVFDANGDVQVIRYGHDPENKNSIATNRVSCVVQRKDGDLWVGGQSTILSRIIPQSRYSDEEPTIERYGVGGWVFTLFEDSEGTLWGGTWGSGLFRLNDATMQFLHFTNTPDDSNSICDDVVWSIYEDKYKNLWVGGNNKGLSILPADQKLNENPQFINFSHRKDNANSLSNNTINSIYQDTKGNMWLATAGGLNLVKNSNTAIKHIKETRQLEFRAFKSQDGLSGNGIVGILEDRGNNMWISTSTGLSFFDLKDSTFTNFHESDGLQSNEFARNCSFINSDGKVFFGGKNGITAFFPNEIKANPFVPKIAFTDFKIFNASVKVGETINKDIILPKALNQLDQIVLSHKNNVFTIDFASLHYNTPEQNLHAYYLKGFDEEWNYVGNSRSATYTNLNPGRYVFFVKGSNNNGIWNEEGKSIKIRVKAAWYNTWLFRILFFVLLVLVIVYAIRKRMEHMRHEKEILQEKIEEGERELQFKKDEIEKQKQEIEEQKQRDNEIRYMQTGISKFSEIIAVNRQDIKDLSNKLITELVNYTKTNAGVIYLIDNSDPENVKLINSGSFCHDSDTFNNQTFMPGEGNIGTCFVEKKTMQFNNLPEGYIVLRSALGSASLKHSILVPIINDEICLGVIELASLADIEPYKADLITKLSESYASVIAINNANQKTQEMLEQNRFQSEELQSQEEELRQNLEEMQATQEELRRQMNASDKAKDKMIFEQTLTNSLLKNTPEKIYFKDLDSRFIKASNSMKDIFKAKKVEDIYGKTDFDFFTEDYARPAFNDEQEIIRTGKPIIGKIEKVTHSDGRIKYVTTTKLPIKNAEEKIIGTFGISKDITEIMELKQDLDKRKKVMAEKDEKLNHLQKEIKRLEGKIKELEAE